MPRISPIPVTKGVDLALAAAGDTDRGVFGERELDVVVFGDAGGVAGGRNDDVAFVQREGECDLMPGCGVRLGDGVDGWDAGAGAAGEGKIAGHGDILRAAEISESLDLEQRMALEPVGRELAGAEDILSLDEVGDGEIGDASEACKPQFPGLCELAEIFLHRQRRDRPADEGEVDLVEADRLERLLQRKDELAASGVVAGDLGGEGNRIAPRARAAEGLAHLRSVPQLCAVSSAR
jgi:hypothetical protein